MKWFLFLFLVPAIAGCNTLDNLLLGVALHYLDTGVSLPISQSITDWIGLVK